MANKDQIIKEVYENLGGFKSLGAIYSKAKEKDDSITRADVQNWKTENVPRVKPLRGFNSYVAPEPKFEFQIDLFNYNYQQPERQILSKQTGKKYTAGIDAYGLLVIDAFTKFVDVQPVERKLATSWRNALDKTFKIMGIPKVVYSDPDSSLLGESMKTYLKEKGVQLISTRQHASMAERAIRTIKAELDAKIEADPKTWTVYLPRVLKEYNENKVHKTIGMTPAQATEEKNEFKVKNRLEIHRVTKRDQPELEKKDVVRMYQKKGTFDKERVPVWEDGTRKVEGIENVLGTKLYKLDNHKQLVLRSDLLKIRSSRNDAERAAAARMLAPHAGSSSSSSSRP